MPADVKCQCCIDSTQCNCMGQDCCKDGRCCTAGGCSAGCTATRNRCEDCCQDGCCSRDCCQCCKR